jgi:hypothetical protein
VSFPEVSGVPKHHRVAWADYFPNIHLTEVLPAGRIFTSLTHLSAKQLFEVFVVEQRPSPGVLATADLPDAFQSLPRIPTTPKHTFVFSGCLAGVNTSVFFDGGAPTSFVESGLVKQYGLKKVSSLPCERIHKQFAWPMEVLSFL